MTAILRLSAMIMIFFVYKFNLSAWNATQVKKVRWVAAGCTMKLKT
jgi:hypothetical protein